MADNGVGVQEKREVLTGEALEADRARALEEKKARRDAAARAKRRKIRRKRIVTLVVILAICGGIAFGMYRLLHDEEPELTIWSDFVTRGSISSMVEGSGMTKAKNSATLTLASGGTVQEVFVTEGQQVTEGDPLYTVDSTDAQKAVDDAQDAVDDYQKQIDALGKSYADLTFTAPFTGKLLDAAELEVGEDIGSGTTLGTLVDDRTMKLSLYFSYVYENEFTVGKTATISVPSVMTPLTGKVETINKVRRVTPEGSTLFEVVFSIVNPGTLTAGMGATAYLTGASGEEVYPYEPGELEYNRSQELVTKAGGELQAVHLINYSDVSAGQVLVQMAGDDNDDQMAALNTSMRTAQENLKKAQDALANYNAVAPISGTVLTCGLVPGETVDAGFAAMTIADTTVITVEAQVDSMNVSYVQPGMECTITAWGQGGEMQYMGVVKSVSLEGNAENGLSTFPAVIEVDNYDGSLRSNDYVSYSMVASESSDCLLVPVQAVKYAATGDVCVFVRADEAPENALDSDELGLQIPEGFYAVPVTVGLSDRSSAEILEGLEEGQEVFIQYMTNEGNSWDTDMAMAMG